MTILFTTYNYTKPYTVKSENGIPNLNQDNLIPRRHDTKPKHVHKDAKRKNEDAKRKKYGPICDRVYNGGGNISLVIVPRRAFYDNRTLSGKPRDLVVILAEMTDSDTVEKSVCSCELNGYYSDDVKVIRENTAWVRKKKPGHTHCNTFIHCVGFPKQAIRRGSIVRLIYRSEEDNCYSRVATEKPLTLMHSESPSSIAKQRHSTVVCTVLFNHPTYFNEWLQYQKTIGVDRVHMNVEASFAREATQRYPFLKEALATGFAHMEVWNNYIGDRIYYYSHAIKCQDCVMQNTGIYDYVFIRDTDEFFIPMIPGYRDIHYYLPRLFSDDLTGSARLKWRSFMCKLNPSLYKSLPDGNVTNALTNKTARWTTNFKTIHRLRGTDIVGVHTAFRRLPNYGFKVGDSNLAYMAHIQPGKTCYS